MIPTIDLQDKTLSLPDFAARLHVGELVKVIHFGFVSLGWVRWVTNHGLNIDFSPPPELRARYAAFFGDYPPQGINQATFEW